MNMGEWYDESDALIRLKFDLRRIEALHRETVYLF